MLWDTSVKSALRMNGAIVILVDSMAELSGLVEKGIVIKDAFTTVSTPHPPTDSLTMSRR